MVCDQQEIRELTDNPALGAVWSKDGSTRNIGQILATSKDRDSETDEDQRDRLFLKVLASIAVNVFAILLIFQFLLPTTAAGGPVGRLLLLSVLGLVFGTGLVFLNFGHRHLCANFLLLLLGAVLFSGSFYLGGMRSPTTAALLLLPVLAATLMDSRWTWFWTIVTLVAWLTMVVLEMSGFPIEQRAKPANIPMAVGLALFGSLLVVMAVMNSYIRSSTELRDRMVEKNQRLDHLASHDTLTGIPNRRFFFDEAQRSMARARRLGKPMAVLVIDLRKFKLVNDCYGHSVGDELLCNFARRLTEGFRGTDFVARLGGDEFAVILANVDGQEGVDRAIARFLATPQQPLEADGISIGCECDIGSALYPEQGENLVELYDIADHHMYQVKHQLA